jgi:hypothetical protein
MEYTNLKQIKQDFSITEDSPAEIRKEVIKRMSLMHPDKNNGKFKSEKEEQEYLRLGSAATFLDEQMRNQEALIPVDKVTELIKSVSTLAIKNRESDSSEKLRIKIDNSIDRLKQQNQTPIVTSTIVSGILTIIWAFPSIVSEHPVLNKIISISDPSSYLMFSAIWIYCLCFTAFIWIRLRNIERKDADLKKRLNLQSIQNDLLKRFIKNIKISNEGKEDFSKAEFISFLMDNFSYSRRLSRSFPAYLFFGRGNGIDQDIAESLAETILSRAETRGYIRRREVKDIEDIYNINR